MSHHEVTEEMLREHLDAVQQQDDERIGALLADDFTQEWPQTGERVRGRTACLAVQRSYPGGAPTISVSSLSGGPRTWVAEGRIRYPDGTDYAIVSILHARGNKLVRQVDYFGPDYPAPEWRKPLVEPLT
jgi:hypothetical protein